MASVRKNLPAEVLESIFTDLPFHILCRCRLVCKAWNRLLTEPVLASLRAQASPQRAPAYILIMPKLLDFDHTVISSLENEAEKLSWEILDNIAEERYFSLSDIFIQDFKLRHPTLMSWRWSKHTRAAGGGLIYAMYEGSQPKRRNAFAPLLRRHIVSNPVAKSFHEIPEPESYSGLSSNGNNSYDRDIALMSVDNERQSYRIIMMQTYHREQVRCEEKLHLYDSTTAKWRQVFQMSNRYRAYSCIFLKDIFYILLVDIDMAPWCPQLYLCDLDTGAMSLIDVKLPEPSRPEDKAHLVVSLGRLFLVEYTALPKTDSSMPYYTSSWEFRFALSKRKEIKVTIWEILLAEKEVVKVAEMPWSWKYTTGLLKVPCGVVGDPVVALGYGDSVVVSFVLGGGSVGFDLVRKRWYKLPVNSRQKGVIRPRGRQRQGIFSGLVDF